MRGSGAFRAAVSPGGALAGPWVRNALWRNARAVPSLDLQFADTKSLADAISGQNLITFTRASSATYVGSDGLIKTAATNEPRFDHNPTTGESLGLLVEEQRTNLVLRSSEISGLSPWSTQGTAPTIQTTAFTAPDGSSNATRMTFATADSRIIQGFIPVTNGTTYTFSLYARPVTSGTLNKIRLACFDSATQQNSNDITLVAGWQRINFTFTSTATGNATINIRNELSAANANDIYIWGAQLEAGAFPTSYISTTTAAVTRSADVASITGTNFSSWYRQDEGTVFADAAAPASVSNTGFLAINNASTTNRLEIRQQRYTPTLTSAGTSASFVEATPGPTIVANVFYKQALAFSSTSHASSVSYGLQTSTTSIGTVAATQLFFGIRDGQTTPTGGAACTFKRVTFWPQRLGNSALQALTQ
jgi:hypothetical protein